MLGPLLTRYSAHTKASSPKKSAVSERKRDSTPTNRGISGVTAVKRESLLLKSLLVSMP